MEFKQYLEDRAALVNDALSRLVAGADEFPQSLHRAMRYSLFAGGKRIRPIFVLASCEAVGGDINDAINTASAFECIHTYSLIHDDLPAIDNDDLRRGIPTCHKAFGEATAILAGDALLTLAFELICRSGGVAREKILRVLLEVSRSAGASGMIGGQIVDIESEGREAPFPVVEYIHIHKTGALILSSVRCGAIIGGAGDPELDALSRYAESAGLAFQIADDLLDIESTPQVAGKSVGRDAFRGKATYPSVIGVEESRKRARELVSIAVDALAGFDEKAEPLREIARYIVDRKN